MIYWISNLHRFFRKTNYDMIQLHNFGMYPMVCMLYNYIKFPGSTQIVINKELII